MKVIFTSVCLLIVTFSSNAQVEIKKDTILTDNVTPVVEMKKWHEPLNISGFTQLRYNRPLPTNNNYEQVWNMLV
jgi:hypothetical protein